MNELIKGTTAYKIFSGDRQSGKLSHAYMLHFADRRNMRGALKLFASEFFGAEKGTRLYSAIESESFTDLKIYPREGEKITADGIAEIIEDGALRPVEGEKKLFIISGFETASVLIQNKMLKTLEEPLEGVYFLLGACSLAPVLGTVLSRVKTLEIPPFSEEQIYLALERGGHNSLNAAAAKSANGVLGVAENMVSGGWFQSVAEAAEEICKVTTVGEIGGICLKYGEIKYREELLSEMQRLYFTALTEGEGPASKLTKPALVYALESIDKASADLKFNANFQGLLYGFLLGVLGANRREQQSANIK